jgi:hypothetical protein
MIRSGVHGIDGHELKSQLLDSLEEPVQVRLVDHVAGQHRIARNQVHRHPLEQEAERFAQLAANDQAVPPASYPVTFHHATLTFRQVTCHHLPAIST